jgi:nucleoside-diphosphate-sugar epimerase
MDKVLILGATGFIGGHIAKKAKNDLDLSCRKLEETARDSINWFLQQGVL